jgi:hypothetical protein
MSGSSASNLGYPNITPFSNVNGNFANKMSENYSGGFSSNEIPTGGANGLSGIKDNVLALSGKVSNMSFFKGGRRKKSKSRNTNIKRKIKNITKIYKMKSKKRARTIKRKLLKKYQNNDFALGLSSISISGGRKRRTKRNRYMQKGGYAQYQNNLPMTPGYSVGGYLSAGSSGQAMPPPIHRYANAGSGDCTDNYNHFTGRGFSSRGH